MTSARSPHGPDWADLLRWLAHSTSDDLLAIDDEWWLRSVVPVTEEGGFPVPDLGPGYLDELQELHRSEMALLFAEAAELRIARRPLQASLLGPRLDPWREARWRRRVRGRLHRAVRDGLEIPLGLMVCWAWPSSRWLGAEPLALASLSFDSTDTGRLVYARARLAALNPREVASVTAEVEQLLGRTRPDPQSPGAAWHAATLGSLFERRGDLPAALAAYQRAALDDGGLGAWARGLALALSLVLADRDSVLALRWAARVGSTRVVQHAEAEALQDIRLRTQRWIRSRRGCSPAIDQELFELIAGRDDLAARVALQFVATL